MAKTNEYDARVEPEQELSATGATIAIPSEAGAVETATASMASADVAPAEANPVEATPATAETAAEPRSSEWISSIENARFIRQITVSMATWFAV